MSNAVYGQTDFKKSISNLNQIFVNPEIEAQFPGGEDSMYVYLNRNLRYPKRNIDADKGGMVYLEFKIDTSGLISDITIARGMNKEFDNEAVRLVKNMPNWKPAMVGNRKVVQYFTLPLIFESVSD